MQTFAVCSVTLLVAVVCFGWSLYLGKSLYLGNQLRRTREWRWEEQLTEAEK